MTEIHDSRIPTGDQVLFAIEQISRHQRERAVRGFHELLFHEFMRVYPEARTSDATPRDLAAAVMTLRDRTLPEIEAEEFLRRAGVGGVLSVEQFLERKGEFLKAIRSEQSRSHIARTTASFIAGVIRSLDMDQIVRWSTERVEFEFGEAMDQVEELRLRRISNRQELLIWRSDVDRHFSKVAVFDPKTSRSHSVRPRGMVSISGARSYWRAWDDFIDRNSQQILDEAVNAPESSTLDSIRIQRLRRIEPGALPATGEGWFDVPQKPEARGASASMPEMMLEALSSAMFDEEEASPRRSNSYRKQLWGRSTAPASGWHLQLRSPRDAQTAVDYQLPDGFDDWQVLQKWLDLAALTIGESGELSATLSAKRGSARINLEAVPSEALFAKLQAFLAGMGRG